ncbi:hypothetical protein XENTR_v10008274 [Xenopus tropicalis]|nr:hypothetical protein XENTR_v10008274 [Xenopus tropicalis]
MWPLRKQVLKGQCVTNHAITASVQLLCTYLTIRMLLCISGGYETFSSQCPEFCNKSSPPVCLSLPLSTSNVPGSADSNCTPCGTPLYDQGGPVEILPFLYLGSAYHASRKDMLDALGITALINVSANCPNHFEGHFQYKSIPVEDSHKADISSWFNEAIDFIGKTKLTFVLSIYRRPFLKSAAILLCSNIIITCYALTFSFLLSNVFSGQL